MSTGPDFLTRETTEDVTIRTTFDPAMQAAAEAALENVFATRCAKAPRRRRPSW
jgi:penicillin-binding protein 1A